MNQAQPPVTPESDTRPRWLAMVTSGAIPVLIFLLFLIAKDLHLSADGVELMRQTVEKGDYAITAESRSHATYISQFLLVSALQLGVSDLTTLNRVFGVSVIFPYLMAYTLMLWVVKDNKSRLDFSWLYTFMLTGVSLPSMYILSTEHQVIVPLTFAIGVLVTRFSMLSARQKILLPLLLLLFWKTYETNIIPLFLIGLALVWLLVKQGPSPFAKAVLGLSIGLCGYGIFLSVFSILHPRDLNNRDGFVREILLFLYNPAFQIWGTCFLAYIVGMVLPKLRVFIVLGVACLGFGIVKGVGYSDIARISFASRSLTILVPAAGILLCYLKAWPRTNWTIGCGWATCLLVAILAVDYSVYTPWADYKQQAKKVLSSQGKGAYLEASEHGLGKHPAAWFWTFPLMSVVWQPDCVQAVMLNPYREAWQPFDPRAYLPFSKNTYFSNTFEARLVEKRCAGME